MLWILYQPIKKKKNYKGRARNIETAYVSVSTVIPMISYIRGVIRNLKSELRTTYQKINKRFEKIEHNHILAVSTVLDIRFKTVNFSDAVACWKAINIIRSEIVIKRNSLAPQEEREGTAETTRNHFNFIKKG